MKLAWASEVTAVLCTAGLSIHFNNATFAFVGAWALRAISRFEAPAVFAKEFQPAKRMQLRSFAAYSSFALGGFGAIIAVRSLLAA